MVRLALVAAVLSLAAVQDEMIDNPDYKGWASQKAGAWVKFKMLNDLGQMKMEGELTMKLKELTAEKAVVDSVSIIEMSGNKSENTQSRSIPVKIKKGTDSDGAKCEIVAEGDEELEVKGKKVKCHWVQMKLHAKSGVINLKNWRCADIVGGSAKMEMTTDAPMKMTTTLTVTDWKEGDK